MLPSSLRPSGRPVCGPGAHRSRPERMVRGDASCRGIGARLARRPLLSIPSRGLGRAYFAWRWRGVVAQAPVRAVSTADALSFSLRSPCTQPQSRPRDSSRIWPTSACRSSVSAPTTPASSPALPSGRRLPTPASDRRGPTHGPAPEQRLGRVRRPDHRGGSATPRLDRALIPASQPCPPIRRTIPNTTTTAARNPGLFETPHSCQGPWEFLWGLAAEVVEVCCTRPYICPDRTHGEHRYAGCRRSTTSRSSVRKWMVQRPSMAVGRKATDCPRRALGSRSSWPWNETQPPDWTRRIWSSGP